ncbi:MAG TPA: acetyltransferase [Bacteroidales bacterium]|nr:acetyltransferase [Bacteroidales bacterium]
MLIVGAGNLGVHMLDQLIQNAYGKEIAFYDDNLSLPDTLYNQYRIIKNPIVLREFLQQEHDYITAVGHSRLREKLTHKISTFGGVLTSIISKNSLIISTFSTIGCGCFLQAGCAVSHDVEIGESCIMHSNTLISHGVRIGKYVTIGPNVTILKNVIIEDYTTLGPNVTIMPNVRIGANALISLGLTVNDDVVKNQTM